MENQISAKIIADSLNGLGQRATTFVVVFPRIVLAEFNTHRVLSRNSASSRAIPFQKMLKKLETNPFVPIAFQKDHSSMQGTEYFEGKELESAQHHWLCAKNNAIAVAKQMSEAGITKQLCNRILEPFMYHQVIVTATEWENFFKLRAHPAAEIHIADLAHKMLIEYNKSEPKLLGQGEFHIPFGDQMHDMKIHNILREQFKGRIPGPDETADKPVPQPEYAAAFQEIKMKIAIARCARVSYGNFEGDDDYNKDIALHDKLAELGHWSPFEHVAVSMRESEAEHSMGRMVERMEKEENDPTYQRVTLTAGWCGNFRGFVQYRKTFEGENAKEPRVEKK